MAIERKPESSKHHVGRPNAQVSATVGGLVPAAAGLQFIVVMRVDDVAPCALCSTKTECGQGAEIVTRPVVVIILVVNEVVKHKIAKTAAAQRPSLVSEGCPTSVGETIHKRDEHRVAATFKQSTQSIKWFFVAVEVTDGIRLHELRTLGAQLPDERASAVTRSTALSVCCERKQKCYRRDVMSFHQKDVTPG